MSSKAHFDMDQLKERYLLELDRKVYVTPKTYLEMNNLFMSLVDKKRADLDLIIRRLSV